MCNCGRNKIIEDTNDIGMRRQLMSVKELYAFIKYIGINIQYGYIIYKIYNLSVIDRFIYRRLLIKQRKGNCS